MGFFEWLAGGGGRERKVVAAFEALADEDEEVRDKALGVIAEFVRLRGLRWFEVRHSAVQVLDSSNSKGGTGKAALLRLAPLLAHPDPAVRGAVLTILSVVNDSELDDSCPSDSELKEERNVSGLACAEAFAALPERYREGLAEHFISDLPMWLKRDLADARPIVALSALGLLCKLPLAASRRYAAAARALSCVAQFEDEARLGALSDLLHFGDAPGNTPLHSAAECGHLGICRKLVREGARPKATNAQKLTPKDLAQGNGHAAVVDFFSTLENVSTMRGGTGEAYAEAMDDPRQIVKLDWYTMPMPGVGGAAGIVHSLLAARVEGTDGRSHVYVVEKAQCPPGHSGDRYENGVFVSHWVSVAPNLSSDPIHCLGPGDIAAPRTMRDLRGVAVGLGPYDVARCNCHHASLAMYNELADAHARVRAMPNTFYSHAAAALAAVGFDVAGSQMSGSAAPSASASGSVEIGVESHSGHRRGGFPIHDDGHDYGSRESLTAATLSQWIYRVAGQGTLSLSNSTEQALVIYAEESQEELRLDPGASGAVQARGGGAQHIRVNRLGLFGLTSIRTRLARLEVLGGRTYSLVESTGSSVTAEAVPHCPLPEGLEVERVSAARGASLVQWGVLASQDTAYVTFRGTATIYDALVDLGFLTNDTEPHGLRVHSGMWAALHQREHNVVNEIARAVGPPAPPGGVGRRVVLCGHSLGGGYAILGALALLHRGLEVTQVLTFGAPQVVVADRASRLWQRLNAITALYINSYDPVPRLPSCLPWVTEGILSPGCLQLSLGPLRLRAKVADFFREQLERNGPVMERYDTVGTLMFLSDGGPCAARLPSSADGSHRAQLGRLPDQVGPFILKFHGIANYIANISKLRGSPAASERLTSCPLSSNPASRER